MKNIIVALLICLATISCSHENKTMECVYLAPIDTLNIEIGAPSLIKIADNYMFVNYSFSGEYNIDVIDIVNKTIMYSFAKKGQGPNEFLQITSLDVFKEKEQWYIELYDNFQRKLVVYAIDSLNYYKGDCLPVYEKHFDMDCRFLEIYTLPNGYIGTGRTEKKFTLLSEDLSNKRSIGDYLICNNHTEDDYMLLSKANYGRLYLSDDRKSILSVVFMAGTLSMYEVKDDSITGIWNHTESGFEYEMKGSLMKQLSPTGYLAAGFSKDMIVGLYSGEKKKGETNYGNEIHLFDMKGNLVKKYRIDSKLYNFCIDLKTNQLYGISFKSDPQILVYKL